MSCCKDCKFFKPYEEKSARGTCCHPWANNAPRHYLDSCCTLYRSTKWRGCLIAFPKGVAIAIFYLLDLLVYFVFGKTLYKRTQGKEKP